MDTLTKIIILIPFASFVIAMPFALYSNWKIDRELYELEKQEPGYKPGYTNIPGPS